MSDPRVRPPTHAETGCYRETCMCAYCSAHPARTLAAEMERLRRHPLAPERCPVCEWTNTHLMNFGSPETGSKWMCHGCAARAIAENAELKAKLENAEAAWHESVGT